MDKLQKLKKSSICRFGWKDFPSYYKYIHSLAIFVLGKGGVLLLGTVLLLGHIRYVHCTYVSNKALNDVHCELGLVGAIFSPDYFTVMHQFKMATYFQES